MLNFCWDSIFFDILITNISEAMPQTPINHSIFWKSVMITFRCVYVNCLDWLRFSAEVSTKLWKMHFFGQFTDHNSEKKHGNYDPIFSSTFSALFVTFIFVFKNSQNLFWCGPPFGPFWFVKHLNFWQKLPIRTMHHTFLEIRHPEVTKNPYYVLLH